MTTTLTEAPAAPIASQPVSREVAMAWYAVGRTAAGRRALAGDPLVVESYARLYGMSAEEMRADLLAVADGIDKITAEGLTRVDCWYLAGLDQFHGPFPAPAAPVVVPAPRAYSVCPISGGNVRDCPHYPGCQSHG
jgi:hypothetical protein